MAISIIKETIELQEAAPNVDGLIVVTKRINLQKGKRHSLVQVDSFVDAYMDTELNFEVVISPYPAIITNMLYEPNQPLQARYPAAGDDSVLFKERYVNYENVPDLNKGATLYTSRQFPSPEIAAMNTSYFYTDHVYINLAIHAPDGLELVRNIALSFMLVLDNKNVSNLEHSLGVLAENHDAMCALIMSNGQMRSVTDLRGNVFPSWRFGGIRPSHMVRDTFWLQLASTNDELMAPTATIRAAIADARQMAPYDSAFGVTKYPDWIKMDLNQGLVAGAIRSDPVPLKYADNGNTLMF